MRIESYQNLRHINNNQYTPVAVKNYTSAPKTAYANNEIAFTGKGYLKKIINLFKPKKPITPFWAELCNFPKHCLVTNKKISYDSSYIHNNTLNNIGYIKQNGRKVVVSNVKVNPLTSKIVRSTIFDPYNGKLLSSVTLKYNKNNEIIEETISYREKPYELFIHKHNSHGITYKYIRS